MFSRLFTWLFGGAKDSGNSLHEEPSSTPKEPQVIYDEDHIPSPNHGGKIAPQFIVLHHTSGKSEEGDISWITNKDSKVSYHYLIRLDGSLVQFVWDSMRAWHAGRSRWKGYKGLNGYSIGIAFHGDTYKRRPSDTEIDSCAQKCIYLMKKFNIQFEGIITHQMIAPKRKNDCSPQTYQRVLERVRELLK